eukprot:g233.t1
MLAAVGVAVAAVMVVVWVERKGRERKERERIRTTGLRVPEDCPTLEKAVERAKGSGEDITTIRLAKGIHEVEGDEVNITDGLPITIVGAGKNETIIQGGVFLISGGDVNSTTKEVLLQDMTIRKTKMNGVFNRGGLPLRIVDVAIDACGWSGVVVMHGARADCTNVTVSKCRFSGFVAYNGGYITLRGERTSVTENATDENGAGYGLDACGSSSARAPSREGAREEDEAAVAATMVAEEDEDEDGYRAAYDDIEEPVPAIEDGEMAAVTSNYAYEA